MRNIPTQVDGATQLGADPFNDIPTEMENEITSTGQTLSAGDLTQAAKATSIYVAGADYYTDSGLADAYVLAPAVVGTGTLKAPTQYFAGMRVRFKTTNANTGACTVSVASLGVQNIKKADGSSDPDPDDINTRSYTTVVYDGTNFILPLKEINLPPLHINIDTENDSTDPAKDILFKAGKARDILDTFDIDLQANMIKQLDAVWVAGTGNGGRASAVPLSANTTYHRFVISKPDGTTDCGFDTLTNASNLLTDATGYTKFRKVGSAKTDGSSNWVLENRTNLGGGAIEVDFVAGKTQIYQVSGTIGARTAVASASPSGIETLAKLFVEIQSGGAASLGRILFTHPLANDIAPSQPNADAYFNAQVAGTNDQVGFTIRNITTDATANVYLRHTSTGAASFFTVSQGGYIDARVS